MKVLLLILVEQRVQGAVPERVAGILERAKRTFSVCCVAMTRFACGLLLSMFLSACVSSAAQDTGTERRLHAGALDLTALDHRMDA